MKKFELFGKIREKSTKGALNELRTQGFIPGVFYGKEENKSVYFFINDIKKLLYTSDIYNVALTIEDKLYSTIVKDTQSHPLTDEPSHIDLMEVTGDSEISIDFPITFVGTPNGVKLGGKATKKLRKLKIKGTISSFPDALIVDVSDVKLGETMKVKDLSFTGFEVIERGSTPLLTVSRTKASAADAEAAAK